MYSAAAPAAWPPLEIAYDHEAALEQQPLQVLTLPAGQTPGALQAYCHLTCVHDEMQLQR